MPQVKKRTVAVLAGNHWQYEHWLANNRHYSVGTRLILALSPERVRGLEFDEIVKVGTWYERSDAPEILQIIEAHLTGDVRK